MEKMTEMTCGKPMRLLFFFALPLMLGNVFQQLYTVADTAIVGRGVGMDALAALGTVDWLNWMFLGIVQGFTQGFSVRIAQKFGQRDYEGLRHAIGVSARMAIWITLVCLILGEITVPWMLRLLHVPEELMAMASLYIRIMIGGIPATMFFNLCASILRAVGDSTTPLKAMMLASIANIVLDCGAVFLMRWGIAGAAGATVVSQLLAGMICMGKMVRNNCLQVSPLHLRSTENRILMMKLGVPIALQNVVISLGGIAVQSVVNGFSMSFIAGFTATNKLYGVLEVAAISYGYAVTTYVGQNCGAGQWRRISEGMRAALGLAVGTSLVIGAGMILLGRRITMCFISDEIPAMAVAAGDTAYRYLFVMSIFLPILYLLHVYRSALQGMGDGTIPFLSGMVELGIRLAISCFMGRIRWQNGIFATEIGAWLGATVILSIAYYRHLRCNSQTAKKRPA